MNLRITLKYEGKLHRTDSPLFEPPAMDATPEHFTTYQDLLAEQDNVVLLILTCMTPELQKEMESRNAYDMNNELKNMFQTQASQELYDTQRLLNASKMEEGQSVSSHVLNMKSYIDKLECLRYPMPRVLAADTSMKPCLFMIELFAISPNSWVFDTCCGIHICKNVQGLRSSNGSDDILDEIHDNPIEPRTKKPSSRSIIQRVSKASHPPDRYYGFLIDLEGRDLGDHDEPDTYRQAMTCSESRKWLEPMNAEINTPNLAFAAMSNIEVLQTGIKSPVIENKSDVYIHQPIIILSDPDVEDAISSIHSPDYIPASPDYFPASPENTSSGPSEDLSKCLLASLAISPVTPLFVKKTLCHNLGVISKHS
nr:hypothetical protein [Tanacetum cinerariifolium]